MAKPKTLQDLLAFAGQNGYRVTSADGGHHNTGSKHYLGQAIDIDHRNVDYNKLLAQAGPLGYRVIDERTRPSGQAVWGGPHFHIEWGGKPIATAQPANNTQMTSNVSPAFSVPNTMDTISALYPDVKNLQLKKEPSMAVKQNIPQSAWLTALNGVNGDPGMAGSLMAGPQSALSNIQALDKQTQDYTDLINNAYAQSYGGVKHPLLRALAIGVPSALVGALVGGGEGAALGGLTGFGAGLGGANQRNQNAAELNQKIAQSRAEALLKLPEMMKALQDTRGAVSNSDIANRAIPGLGAQGAFNGHTGDLVSGIASARNLPAEKDYEAQLSQWQARKSKLESMPGMTAQMVQAGIGPMPMAPKPVTDYIPTALATQMLQNQPTIIGNANTVGVQQAKSPSEIFQNVSQGNYQQAQATAKPLETAIEKQKLGQKQQEIDLIKNKLGLYARSLDINERKKSMAQLIDEAFQKKILNEKEYKNAITNPNMFSLFTGAPGGMTAPTASAGGEDLGGL